MRFAHTASVGPSARVDFPQFAQLAPAFVLLGFGGIRILFPHQPKIARDAGFANVEIVPTSGKPGVFGIPDAGATTTVGIYLMYDVKQFDPSEWSSPPLEGRIVDKEGLGRICVGRVAVNQKGPETAFLGALYAFKASLRFGIKQSEMIILDPQPSQADSQKVESRLDTCIRRNCAARGVN
jgi:hypothetical protein